MDRTVTQRRDDLDVRPPIVDAPFEDRRPLARLQAVPWLIVIALLAAVAWLGWKAFFDDDQGSPIANAMLAFEKQNSLTVFSSRFQVVAQSENTKRVLGLPVIRSSQAMIVPASVEYRVDLGEVDRDNLSWDEGSQTLTVNLPAITTTTPNIDEGRALYFEDGLYVPGGTSRSMSQNNSRQAAQKATDFARNPEVLSLARNAARQAIRQNLAIPLQVAGYQNAKVTVRFAGEKPPAD